jgi:hypothetical protein
MNLNAILVLASGNNQTGVLTRILIASFKKIIKLKLRKETLNAYVIYCNEFDQRIAR